MQEKIEWYQEVLALEPGSKVFFPLARLLGQSGQPDEGIRVLRLGLERHPEYIEARLLLVQLLRESDDGVAHAACTQELDEITKVFAAYPGFWEAWSSHGPSADVAWALRFLAAAFKTPGISLQDVLVAGLQALNGDAVPGIVSRNTGSVPAAPAVAELAASLQQAVVSTRAEAEPAAHGDDAVEADEPSLRTRTMADVLAEQGDIHGALEIYQEILSRTPEGDEANGLRGRIDALSAKASSAPPPARVAAVDATNQNKMKSMLENLAQRLDARAEA